MAKELPERLDTVFPHDESYMDNVYGFLAVHCLVRLGEKKRLTGNQVAQRDFIRGYLSRQVLEPERHVMDVAQDDKQLLKYAWRIDQEATLKVERAMDWIIEDFSSPEI